jgi:hypothetical protein
MTSTNFLRALLRGAAACLLGLAALPAMADADSLRAKYNQLRDELRSNPYGRSMHIDSAESERSLRGDVYAVLDHPYSKVVAGMREPAQWCDIMILPFNTKYCNAAEGDEPRLAVRIGRKYDQPVEQAYKLDFAFRNVAAGSDYFETRLAAREGPVGTRDYRISVEAIPLDANRTFMRLSYSYGVGAAGRFAMQAYLSTAGADKVGFSTVGRDAAGKPQLIGGVRGAIERNVMRYYLAIDSYLDSLDAPKHQQAERRIQQWFTETEKYARQLHEMDRTTYVTMKRAEVERQQSVAIQ